MNQFLKTILLITAFSFSACSQKKVEIKYVKSKCPKSRNWDINKTIPTFKLIFKKEGKRFITEEPEFLNYVDFVKKIKSKLIKAIKIINLHEEQNQAHNKLRSENGISIKEIRD